MNLSTPNQTFICPNGTIDLLTRYNGSDLLMYSKFAPAINDKVEKISYPFWCLIGLPGSVLSLIIWSRQSLSRVGSPAASVYQAALAAVDVAFFIVQMIWYLHTAWHLRTLDRSIICEGFAILNYLIQYASPTLSLVFTVERYIAICFPFWTASRFSVHSLRKAGIVVFFSIFFCCSLAGIQGYFYSIMNGNCGLRPLFEAVGGREWMIYTAWSMVTELLIFGLLPIICLVLNVLVILELHKIRKHDKFIRREYAPPAVIGTENSNGSSLFLSNPDNSVNDKIAKHATTLTLLCVSFYLIIAHLSVAVMVLLYILLPMGDECLSDEQITADSTWKRHFRFFTVRSLIESFGISHFAAKFYIYLATSATFREHFINLVCPCTNHVYDRSSYQEAGSARVITNDSSAKSYRKCSTLGSSNFQLALSKTSVNQPSRRLSSSSMGSRNSFCDKRFYYTPRQRTQKIMSKNVLDKIGEQDTNTVNMNSRFQNNPLFKN